MAKLRTTLGAEAYDAGRYAEAAAMFVEMVTAEEFEDFLTLPAYERVVTLTG